ncbi:MAG: hypothetical protein JNJ49_06620 [Bdellovibrionaceae bacterium]|nr:hypothetical protein [Pseudobdellovibrionaceae bacterium]
MKKLTRFFFVALTTLTAYSSLSAAQTTVSGISSGGFMAEQLAVSSSKRIKGVATVAGGMYFCAQDHFQNRLAEYGEKSMLAGVPSPTGFSLTWMNPAYRAIEICMHNPRLALRGELMGSKELKLEFLTEFEKAGEIDPVSYYREQRSLIFHGIADTVIQSGMAKQIADFKKTVGVPVDQIKVVEGRGGHTFPTDRKDGGGCAEEKVPYLGNCGVDLAGQILEHLYSDKMKRGKAATVQRISQSIPGRPSSVAEYGYFATSNFCLANPRSCRLHVALHGCKMSDSFDEEFQNEFEKSLQKTVPFEKPDMTKRTVRNGLKLFAERAGFVEYASVDTNRLMVLFPQTWISEENFPTNPKGCWDWFGWADRNYAKKSGKEIQFLNALISEVESDPRRLLKAYSESSRRGP